MIRPPVLCYHRVGGPREVGVTRVRRKVFARQMTALAKGGWRTLTLDDFARSSSPYLFPVARLTSDTPYFLLTLDDGYANLVDTVYPVLADLGFTATTFLITDYVGRDNGWDVRYTRHRLRHLDWRTIEQWRIKGFDFGSHSATHRRLTWLRNAVVTDELYRSRQALIQRLGTGAGRAIAYPFGAVSDRVINLARQAGFEMGFAGAWERGVDPLRLPRVPVYAWDALNTPIGLWPGVRGTAGRFVAHLVNRCSVGTSLALVFAGRYRSRWSPGAEPG